MLTYHNVTFVLEYLRVSGVSQKTQDRILSLLWKEARQQERLAERNGEEEGTRVLS
jgi:hypothetical protein